jgi:hypothetical protein
MVKIIGNGPKRQRRDAWNSLLKYRLARFQPALDFAQNGAGRDGAVLFSRHLDGALGHADGPNAHGVVDGLLTLPMVLPRRWRASSAADLQPAQAGRRVPVCDVLDQGRAELAWMASSPRA